MDNQKDKDFQEQDQSLLLANEDDILRGLFEAHKDQVNEAVPVTISRKGKVYFSFRVHGLPEEKYQECRRKATRYEKNKTLGAILPVETDTIRYRSMLIYEATAPEDRAKLWDNKEAWTKLNVLNGLDLIDKVLLAGEKEEVLVVIDELSGYKDKDDEVVKEPEQRQVELAKN